MCKTLLTVRSKKKLSFNSTYTLKRPLNPNFVHISEVRQRHLY
jgi:hypothetical protein